MLGYELLYRLRSTDADNPAQPISRYVLISEMSEWNVIGKIFEAA